MQKLKISSIDSEKKTAVLEYESPARIAGNLKVFDNTRKIEGAFEDISEVLDKEIANRETAIATLQTAIAEIENLKKSLV